MSRPEAVGGPILTTPVRWILGVFLVGAVIMLWRFIVGLGPTTGLNDGYPWGIWIAFDVVTGTALACGGYAVALLVYILNKGKYHPLVRPALLTSALGYSVAAVGIIIDVGRPWFIWRIPISVGKWNLDSALLEVALCVMAYVMVLWIELSPVLVAANSFYPEPLTVQSGGVRSISTGDAIIATNAETQLLRESVTNPDLRIIMTVTESFYRLVGRRSAGIDSLADLRGKRIMVPRFTSANYYLVAMLREVGLTEDDVELVNLPPARDGQTGMDQMSDALLAGDVDVISI